MIPVGGGSKPPQVTTTYSYTDTGDIIVQQHVVTEDPGMSTDEANSILFLTQNL